MTSAIASRVTSSWVGPSPPHTTTASAFSSISRSAAIIAAEVVADLAVLHRVDADRGELLADPARVRVDDLAEQQLGADREDVSSHSSDSCQPRADDVDARDDRERDRDPQDARARAVHVRAPANTNAPTDSIWSTAFHLPSCRAGSEMPARAAADR